MINLKPSFISVHACVTSAKKMTGNLVDRPTNRQRRADNNNTICPPFFEEEGGGAIKFDIKTFIIWIRK